MKKNQAAVVKDVVGMDGWQDNADKFQSKVGGLYRSDSVSNL